MTLDEEIAAVERNLIDRVPDAVVAAIEAAVPASLAFFISPLGKAVVFLLSPLLKKLAAVIVKFFDNKGYYLYKVQVNNAEAQKFVDAARATNQATESGDPNAISAARAAERAAFLSFWPLTS